MGHKKIKEFKDADKYIKYRQRKVRTSLSLDWEDSWATDKLWLKQLDNIYVCKFCAKKMYAADYREGVIVMSCRTPLCPGNINHEMKEKVNWKKYDIRELTNQYLFDSMLRF